MGKEFAYFENVPVRHDIFRAVGEVTVITDP
jgi:hypothetical protein